MRGSSARRTTARRLVFQIAAAGVAWAIAQPILSLSQRGVGVMYIGNGVAFAVYASLLFAIRPGRHNVVRAVIVGLAGATHFLWVMTLALTLRPSLPRFMQSEAHAMLCVTGMVLGALVAVVSGRVLMLLPVALATTLALGVNLIPAPTLDPMIVFASGVGLLHLGLLAALVPDTLQRLSERPGRDACQSCGYDLRGLPAATCPECGSSASQ